MICSECKTKEIHGMMSGQGFTPYVCERCGQKGYWHNTNVPKVCPQCSKDYHLCEHCGATLEDDRDE